MGGQDPISSSDPKEPVASNEPFHTVASNSPLAVPGAAFGREGEAAEPQLAPVTLTAGDVEQVTVHRWHPEIGGASVKDHSELLGRGPNADLTIILSLQSRKEP